jgi:hypothetical protein
MSLRITGGMGHGNLKIMFQLVFPQLIFCIDTVTFKYCLDCEKLDAIVCFEFLG